MTHRGRNVNAEVSTSFDVRGIVRFTLLALVMLASAANTHASEKTLASFARAGEDLMIASHVRAALRKEERLRPLIPHVTVTKGIAHLSGPVPSADLKKRAVEIAAKVDGVLKIEAGGLYFAKIAPPSASLTLPLEDEKPTQTQSASPNSLSGTLGALTARDSLSSSPSSSSPQRVTLMAPEAVATPSRSGEPARLTAQPRTPSAAASLPSALERLRRSDARFRAIRTEVQGTTVRVLTGTAAGEQVMDFARVVRGLPGVQRVIIQDTFARSR